MDLDNSSSNKTDTLVDLVEKLLEKLSAVDCQMKEKCDIETVNQLEAKVKVLEDRSEQQRNEHVDKLSMLEQKIKHHLEEGICRQVYGTQIVNVGSRELTQEAVDEAARRTERDNDMEKCSSS